MGASVCVSRANGTEAYRVFFGIVNRLPDGAVLNGRRRIQTHNRGVTRRNICWVRVYLICSDVLILLLQLFFTVM